MICPKCKAPRSAGAVECPRCGVIYARFEAAAAKKRADDAENLRAAQAARQAAEEDARQEPEPAAPETKPADTSKIVDCPACGKPVSIMADACPSCGHPVDKSLRLSPLEKKLNAIVGYAAIALLFAIMSGVYYCSHQLTKSVTGGTGEELRPAPIKKPNIRSTPSTPRVGTISPKSFGCHDIDDFRFMVAEARKGNAQNFAIYMEKYAMQGKCDMVRVRTATALEFLPGGAVRIRDANDVEWWVSDAAVR